MPPLRADGAGRARDRLGGATRRESSTSTRCPRSPGGDGARGLTLIEEHLREFPRDALLVNQASSLIGFGGRADREEYRLAFLERLAPAYGARLVVPVLARLHVPRGAAFRRVANALPSASLAQYPGNAGASHNIAHVAFEAADNDGGVASSEPWLAGYDRRAPLSLPPRRGTSRCSSCTGGNAARALEIHQRDIVPLLQRALSLMDGAALLWRLHLYQAPRCAARLAAGRGDRGARVAPGFTLGDVHAALAYAGCGDAARRRAPREPAQAARARASHRRRGRAAAGGGRGGVRGERLRGALAHLEPVDADIHRMGGSHAQWELFEGDHGRLPPPAGGRATGPCAA